MMPSATFIVRWDTLALLGGCDDYGSAEYRRVRHWWIAAGRPWVGVFDLWCTANGVRTKLFKDEAKAGFENMARLVEGGNDDEEGN